MFYKHMYDEHSTHIPHSVFKKYTQATVPCVLNYDTAYIFIIKCFHSYYSLMKVILPMMESTYVGQTSEGNQRI
jgi:hypothetical protein